MLRLSYVASSPDGVLLGVSFYAVERKKHLDKRYKTAPFPSLNRSCFRILVQLLLAF